jgi:hypothetical protein
LKCDKNLSNVFGNFEENFPEKIREYATEIIYFFCAFV